MWHTPLIQALGRLTQVELCEFETKNWDPCLILKLYIKIPPKKSYRMFNSSLAYKMEGREILLFTSPLSSTVKQELRTELENSSWPSVRSKRYYSVMLCHPSCSFLLASFCTWDKICPPCWNLGSPPSGRYSVALSQAELYNWAMPWSSSVFLHRNFCGCCPAVVCMQWFVPHFSILSQTLPAHRSHQHSVV